MDDETIHAIKILSDLIHYAKEEKLIGLAVVAIIQDPRDTGDPARLNSTAALMCDEDQASELNMGMDLLKANLLDKAMERRRRRDGPEEPH